MVDPDLLVARALDAAGDVRARAAVAAADMAVREVDRLPEKLRSLAVSALDNFLASVEQECRDALSRGGLDVSGLSLPPGPRTLLGNRALQATKAPERALARALEHRHFEARTVRESDWVAALPGDRDPEVARRAVAYLLAEARRFGDVGTPAIVLDDMASPDAEQVLWLSLAALIERDGGRFAAASSAVQLAHARLFAAHDPSRSAQSLAHRLARRLEDRGRLADVQFVAAAEEGRLRILAAMFAVRLDIDDDFAFGLVTGAGDPLAVASRAAGLGRRATEAVLAACGHRKAGASARAAKALTDADIGRVLDTWRLHPGFVAAQAAVRARDEC